MEKQKIYVLTYNHYDYYEFTDLLFASTDLDEVINFHKENKNKVTLYFNNELSEQDKEELYNSEMPHCLVTEF